MRPSGLMSRCSPLRSCPAHFGQRFLHALPGLPPVEPAARTFRTPVSQARRHSDSIPRNSEVKFVGLKSVQHEWLGEVEQVKECVVLPRFGARLDERILDIARYHNI